MGHQKTAHLYKELLLKQRNFFRFHQTLSLDFRLQKLSELSTNIKKNEELIFAALQEDLSKPELESLLSETGCVLEEIKHFQKHLEEWASPHKVSTPLVAQPAKSMRYAEPKGVVLIISPWNYPFSLAMMPLVGALAAGNCVVLKPSELAPATSKIIKKIISETFSEEHVSCVEGDENAAKALLEEKYDHIFFTGSTAVGKKVMKAAAEHLTPVTLELGGKSPCIVESSASLDVAAKRIVWGKFFNAGQTCVAPDYVLVHASIFEKFTLKLKNRIHEEFGEDPAMSSDYARIINDKHFSRLMSYLSDGRIVSGGLVKPETRYIAPTLLTDVSLDSKIMEEEIFGPILPLIPWGTFEDIQNIIYERANPLALYVFTENKDFEEKVLSEIPFGGGCVNDTLLHVASSELPFGGRGESGMGAYHGKASFETFSHLKSVLHKTTLIDPSLRYRPYAKRLQGARWLMG